MIVVCLAPMVAVSSEYDILQGLFCDFTDTSKPYRKSNCLCIELIDHKNIATFNIRKGNKRQGKTYSYEIKGNQLTIDMQGDGGLDQVVLTIKSNDTIVSQFVRSKNRRMSFERQDRSPDICW